MFSLSFNGNNWNDHQGVEIFFSLKILSLCEGKLLKDLTRDSHKPQYEQQQNVARIYLLYLGQIRNPKHFKSLRAELEILQKKHQTRFSIDRA